MVVKSQPSAHTVTVFGSAAISPSEGVPVGGGSVPGIGVSVGVGSGVDVGVEGGVLVGAEVEVGCGVWVGFGVSVSVGSVINAAEGCILATGDGASVWGVEVHAETTARISVATRATLRLRYAQGAR
jgi:hypothetical protein